MKYLVIGSMKHDGKRQKVGAQIDLDDSAAARLVAGGFLVPMKAEVPPAADEDKGAK